MATSQHKNPCLGFMKLTHLVDPTLVIIKCLACLNYSFGQRRFLKKCINFSIFPQEIPPLGWVEGHEAYNFLSPYHTDNTFQIWLRLAQQILRRCKRTTHDAHQRQRTPTHNKACHKACRMFDSLKNWKFEHEKYRLLISLNF